ncbi:hypothetical protein D3C85_741730 [compost metagenome]
MMIKLNELISADCKEVPLPVIIYCTEGFCIKEKKFAPKNHHVVSAYYQTSKMRCGMFHKPLHIKKNEK